MHSRAGERDDNDEEQKDPFDSLSKMRLNLKCKTCNKELCDPITITGCGHTVCRKCGLKHLRARIGFHESDCPVDGCKQFVSVLDFDEKNVNLKLREIQENVERTIEAMKDEYECDDGGCSGGLKVREPAKKGRSSDEEEEGMEEADCDDAMDVDADDDAPAFQSELLSKLYEMSEDVADVNDERANAVFEKSADEVIKSTVMKSGIVSVSDAKEECKRMILDLKLEGMMEEIDDMNTNQLSARYVQVFGDRPPKKMTKSEYKTIFLEKVDPDGWRATSKYLEEKREARKNRCTIQSQKQDFFVSVEQLNSSSGGGRSIRSGIIRDSLAVDERVEVIAEQPAMVVTEEEEENKEEQEKFTACFSRLRSGANRMNNRRASTNFDRPEAFALTNISASDDDNTNKTEAAARKSLNSLQNKNAYDDVANKIQRCGRHAEITKDDQEALDEDVTHCIVTLGATFDENSQKYIIKKRSARYLEAIARGLWTVSIEWLDSRKGTNKYIEEDDFEIHDNAGTWDSAGGIDSRVYNSAFIHRTNKEKYLANNSAADEFYNENNNNNSSESDSIMLTRKTRYAKEIAAAKSSGIFNGLKIVVDVPKLLKSLPRINNNNNNNNNKRKTKNSGDLKWSLPQKDCARILECAGAEIVHESDLVTNFQEDTYPDVPDSEEEEEEDINNSNSNKLDKETCEKVNYVLLDGNEEQTDLNLIEKMKKTFPNARVVDWHWFVHCLVKGYEISETDTYELPLLEEYPREQF